MTTDTIYAILQVKISTRLRRALKHKGEHKMYQSLKTEIKDIIEIVKQCPESLQEKCFELLLENYLSDNGQNDILETKAVTPVADAKISVVDVQNENDSEENRDFNTEISMKEFHVKVQRFLTSNNISNEQINYLYYKEDEKLKPLYDSLNSTNMSECQIRIALLTAFENAFSDSNGEMSFNCEDVRARCNAMKCYNSANFTSYFKNNNSLWENWPEKYDKNLSIVLSVEGKKELAKVLLDLAKGE